jgi:hypothetical protein
MAQSLNSELQVPPGTIDVTMTDDSLVTFDDDGVFHEVGYAPVVARTVAGNSIPVPQGKALFISYAVEGVQSPDGTINFTGLHYTLFEAKGHGTFSQAADGTPTYTGLRDLVELAEGDLINGQLGFTPTGGVDGKLSATTNVDGARWGELDITVQHPAADLGHTATGGLTLTGGTLHAEFVPLEV